MLGRFLWLEIWKTKVFQKKMIDFYVEVDVCIFICWTLYGVKEGFLGVRNQFGGIFKGKSAYLCWIVWMVLEVIRTTLTPESLDRCLIWVRKSCRYKLVLRNLVGRPFKPHLKKESTQGARSIVNLDHVRTRWVWTRNQEAQLLEPFIQGSNKLPFWKWWLF